MDESNRFISQQPWKGGALLEADWNGRVLLGKCRHPDHQHDGIRLRNGNVLLLCLFRLPQEIAVKVQGGIPRHGAQRRDVRGLSTRNDD